MNDSRPGCLVCVTGLLAMAWAVLVVVIGPAALAPKTTDLQFALVVAQPILLFLSAIAGYGRVSIALVFAVLALCSINGFLVSARDDTGVGEILWVYQELAWPSYAHAIVCVAALAWQRWLTSRASPPDDRSLPTIRDLRH